MIIQEFVVTKPQEFITEHADKMTLYIKKKLTESALRLINDFISYNENPRFGKQEEMTHIVLLATDNDVVGGCQYFYFSPSTPSARFFGVYVDPEFRGRHAASEMINTSIKYLIARGKTDVTVTLAKNTDGEGPEYYLEDYFERMRVKYPEVHFTIVTN